MLILTRRVGEKILIDIPPSKPAGDQRSGRGEPVRVVITSVKGNQVRIGISASSEIAIVREELLE
ncbi:MAG: carbon storage regulator [Thiotrichaceae bacterium]